MKQERFEASSRAALLWIVSLAFFVGLAIGNQNISWILTWLAVNSVAAAWSRGTLDWVFFKVNQAKKESDE